MGTTVEMVLVGGELTGALGAFALAETLANQWERTFSRFRPDSELSRLNAAAGHPVVASEELFSCVNAAVTASRQTAGLFDPTILPALLAIGYDRTFAKITGGPADPPAPVPAPGPAGIQLDPTNRTITLEPGARIDLGGIAKGMYADVLAARLSGWPGGAVSAGGDLRVWGVSPTGDDWRVGVEDPSRPDRDVAMLVPSYGGVATSGISRRSWRRGRQTVHHLIDPRTGAPARTGIQTVTVTSPTAMQAEVAATALFVGGEADTTLARILPLISNAIVVQETGEIREITGHLEVRSHASHVNVA
jgi:thiamine biosynthesis lipoprotein